MTRGSLSGIQRILVITDEIYPDGVSGIGKSLNQTCLSWVKSGHEIHVLLRRLRPNLPLEELSNGIAIHRLPGPQRGTLWYYAYPLSIVIRGWRWLSRLADRPTAAVIHNPLYMLPAVWSGLGRQVPLVLQLHAPFASEVTISAQRGKYGSLGWLARLVAALIQRLEGWAIHRADHVLVTSRYMQGQFESLHPGSLKAGRFSVVPLGVDPAAYQAIPRREARERLSLDVNRPVLISVRRLVGRMGLTALIEAMTHIRAAVPDALLLLAGEGYLRPQLERQITELGLEDHVHLLGFVDEADLPATIAAADLYVLPTEQLEGFGLGTVEAMMVGVTVVGTPVGATVELLSPIEPRLLTRDASPRAIAEAVIDWLQHTSDRQAVARRCQEAARQSYDADKLAARLLDILEQVRRAKLAE